MKSKVKSKEAKVVSGRWSVGILSWVLFCLFTVHCALTTVHAQTTEFTYQGKLNVSGTAASSPHDFEFRLCSSDTGDCTQTPANGGVLVDTDNTHSNITVANGIFSVKLNFTASSAFDGSSRWLEIRVKPNGSPGPYQMLSPRQSLTSAPYAVKALNADTATNSSQLGGVAANEYVTTSNGGTNFIQNNPASQQAGSFNINGTATANIVRAETQFNMGSNRILSNSGTENLFAGVGAGASNASGERNSFFGSGAGQANTDGSFNAFFGRNAGLNNATGSLNAFFGQQAGFANIDGGDNSFFGTNAGGNTTGSRNSFFGRSSGQANLGGSDNVFFGMFAGNANRTGNNNTIIGTSADLGANNLNFASAIGAGATVGTSNTVVLGRPADLVQVPGGLNVSGNLTGNGSLLTNLNVVLNTTIVSQSVTVFNNGTNTAYPTCAAGWRVVGGGYSKDLNDLNIFNNRPTDDGTGWMVSALNLTGFQLVLTAWAVCARIN